jgi:purine-binding chemotaxis protein CheW
MTEAYLLFEVAQAAYAVPSSTVQFVEMVEKITRVPNAPSFVEGVVSARGQIIPVISVRKRFHMEPAPINLRSRIIIVRVQDRLIGMLVDAAREFTRINTEEILPPPEMITGQIVEYIEGVIRRQDRLILVVNLQRLFSEAEQAAVVDPSLHVSDTAETE